MDAATSHPHVASAASPLDERLAQIIEGLRRAVAARAAKRPAIVAVVLVLWPYLHRVAVRFASVLTRPRRARRSQPRTQHDRTSTLPPKLRLPRGFAWLIRLAPEAAAFGSQLRHLLADPDMAALVQASPEAARTLRPLCRMLGIRPGPDVPAALFAKPVADPIPPAAPTVKPTETATTPVTPGGSPSPRVAIAIAIARDPGPALRPLEKAAAK